MRYFRVIWVLVLLFVAAQVGEAEMLYIKVPSKEAKTIQEALALGSQGEYKHYSKIAIKVHKKKITVDEPIVIDEAYNGRTVTLSAFGKKKVTLKGTGEQTIKIATYDQSGEPVLTNAKVIIRKLTITNIGGGTNWDSAAIFAEKASIVRISYCTIKGFNGLVFVDSGNLGHHPVKYFMNYIYAKNIGIYIKNSAVKGGSGIYAPKPIIIE